MILTSILHPLTPYPTPTQVFLDLTQGGRPLGRVIIRLYDNIVPKTAKNFLSLCSGQGGWYVCMVIYNDLNRT